MGFRQANRGEVLRIIYARTRENQAQLLQEHQIIQRYYVFQEV